MSNEQALHKNPGSPARIAVDLCQPSGIHYALMGRWRSKWVRLSVVLMVALWRYGAHGDDLGPYLSACVGAGCPPLSDYPSPFNFGPVPPSWRGHDEAFSGIALGTFTVPAGGGAESEGRLAIGGDFLPARGFSVGISGGGTFVVGPQMNFDNLIVRGAATGSNMPFVGTVATLGTTVTGLVRIGGAASGITFDMGVVTQNVGTTPADLGIDVDAIFTQLQAKSLCWSQLSATGVLVDEVTLGNGWVLVGDGTSIVQVFNLGPGDLAIPTQELNFRSIPPGATVLINVSGATPTVNAARVNADVTGSPTLFDVLFNLFAATAATIPSDVNGSVLIPNGSLTLGGSVNGRLAVGGSVTFSGSGQELHNYPFTGDLPDCSGTPTPSATSSQTPTETPTDTPTATASDTPSQTPTTTATATVTATPTATETSTSTATPSQTPTATPTHTPTPTPNDTPSATATATATATLTATLTATETITSTATGTSTLTPSATPTSTVPSATPTQTPTVTSTATASPSATITAVPSVTRTGTATATPSRQPTGAACTSPDQCQSEFCVDGVCCDTACDGPGQRCDLPGREGQCLSVAPAAAPALSAWSILAAVLTLICLGAAGLQRAKR